MQIGVVEGIIRLRDEFTSKLNTSASALEKHGRRMEKVGRQMSDIGGQLTRTLTLPMVAVGGAAIKMSTDLNEGMANVATLIPGNTARVAALRDEIQGLAVDVGKSTDDLTDGLYQTISAFGDTADTVKVLEINARAATAGLASTLEAIDLTSAVTKGYGDTSAEAVQKVADLALMTVRLGQTTFPDLAASMGRVIPLAEAVGQSQEEMFAVFATATGVVGRASEVATQYRGIINALLKPTDDLSKLIAAQGFASGEAMLRQLGLVDTLELIGNTAKTSGKPITDYIAQIEAVPLALALAGPQADVFREKLRAMGGAAGTTDAAFREQTEGVNAAGFAWKKTREELEVALQKLGQELLPIFTTFLGALRPVIGGLEGVAAGLAALPGPGRAAVLALAGIAAAAGPVLFTTGQLITAWGTLVATAPRVAAGIRLVTGALLTIPAAAAAALLGINELFKAWGRAEEAATSYIVATNDANEVLRRLTQAKVAGGLVDPKTWAAAEAMVGKLQDRVRELNESIKGAGPLSGGGKTALGRRLLGDVEADRKELAETFRQLQALRQALGGLRVDADDAAEGLEGIPPAGVVPGMAALTDEVLAQVEALRENKKELADQVGQLSVYVDLLREAKAAMESRPLDLTLPSPTGTGDIDIGPGDVDWGALEAGYREFFGNAEQIHENYLESLQRSFGDAFRDLFRDGKLSFRDFFRSVADIGINLFAEQLSAALTAALEGVEGAWKNLTKAMSSGAGQMAGWLTAVGIVAGAENVDYSAIGAALGAVVGGIIGGVAGMGAFSLQGAAAGASLGAAVGAWLGSMVKKGSPEFFGAIESELGKIQIGMSELGGGAKTVAKVFQDDLQEAMTRILEQIGGTLEGIGGGISLKMKDDKLSVFIDGLEHRFKEDIEGGISFALTEALKRADISGASATFVQILQNTTAKSLEQLSDALDWGRWYERLRLGDVAADLQDRMFKFGQDIRRAIEFGLDTSFITIDLASDFDAYRNQILGIVESEEERIRRQAEAFNQWRAITQAEQLARQADLIIRKADLDAEIALLKASMAIDESHLNFRREMLDAELQLSTAEWELLHAKLQALAAVEQALAVVEGILASLPDLISGTEIEDAVKRARGGRGGQRKADMDAVQQMLEDAADALLPEFAQALKAINDKWDEAVLKAHENAGLLDEIAAAREREIAALREQRLLDFGAELADFLSGGGSGSGFVDAVHALQDRIAELGADLGQLVEDLGLTAHEMLFFWQAVLAGQKEMERKLATEGFVGLVRGLAELTQDEQLRHELLMAAAAIEFDLKMAQYQLEFDMLQALGYLTAEQIALIDEALGNIAANRDLIIRSQVPIPGAGGGGGPDPADERARALARLRDIQARSLDPFSQAIRGVVDEFAELRRVLGWTSEVQAVYAAEIQRVLTEQLEPIRRLQEELAFRSDSPMRSIDQFRLAQQQVNEAQAALRAGDLSQLELLPGLIDRVLELNPSSQASEASRFLFEWASRALDEAAEAAEAAVSGIVPGTATDPWTWLRDTPSAGDELIAQTIRDLGRDLGSGLDDVETSIHIGTGGIEDKLPFDWSLVGVNAGPADNPTPPPDDGPRRIAAEARSIEALQHLREIKTRTVSMDDSIRSGSLGVRASVG